MIESKRRYGNYVSNFFILELLNAFVINENDAYVIVPRRISQRKPDDRIKKKVRKFFKHIF